MVAAVALTLPVGAAVAFAAGTVQEFAPKAQLPAGAGSGGMVAMMLASAEVPAAAEVGVPAYPGAQLVQAMHMPNPVTREQTGSVRLISTDPPDAVIAWYAGQLEGWSRQDGLGGTGFGEGGREYNPMNPQTWGVVPSVQVEGDDMYAYGDVWPGVQTVIEINYPLE